MGEEVVTEVDSPFTIHSSQVFKIFTIHVSLAVALHVSRYISSAGIRVKYYPCKMKVYVLIYKHD